MYTLGRAHGEGGLNKWNNIHELYTFFLFFLFIEREQFIWMCMRNVYIYIYIYIYMYVYTHTHTHVYTHKFTHIKTVYMDVCMRNVFI